MALASNPPLSTGMTQFTSNSTRMPTVLTAYVLSIGLNTSALKFYVERIRSNVVRMSEGSNKALDRIGLEGVRAKDNSESSKDRDNWVVAHPLQTVPEP